MKDKIIAWIWSNNANSWSILLFVSSAIISCVKSIYELFYPSCSVFDYASYTCSQFPHVCASLAMRTMTLVNFIIIIFFVVSMALAFINDSVKDPKNNV